MDRDAEEEGDDTADKTWDRDAEGGNEVSPKDGLQDLQYFPNFYNLLKSLDSGKQRQKTSADRNCKRSVVDGWSDQEGRTRQGLIIDLGYWF